MRVFLWVIHICTRFPLGPNLFFLECKEILGVLLKKTKDEQWLLKSRMMEKYMAECILSLCPISLCCLFFPKKIDKIFCGDCRLMSQLLLRTLSKQKNNFLNWEIFWMRMEARGFVFFSRFHLVRCCHWQKHCLIIVSDVWLSLISRFVHSLLCWLSMQMLLIMQNNNLKQSFFRSMLGCTRDTIHFLSHLCSMLSRWVLTVWFVPMIFVLLLHSKNPLLPYSKSCKNQHTHIFTKNVINFLKIVPSPMVISKSTFCVMCIVQWTISLWGLLSFLPIPDRLLHPWFPWCPMFLFWRLQKAKQCIDMSMSCGESSPTNYPKHHLRMLFSKVLGKRFWGFCTSEIFPWMIKSSLCRLMKMTIKITPILSMAWNCTNLRICSGEDL